MKRKPLIALLSDYQPCPEALVWARKYGIDYDRAWHECEQGNWLLWIASNLGVDRKKIVLAAGDCARLALTSVPEGEDRPRLAIEAAEKWVREEISFEELSGAYLAATLFASAANAPVAAAADAAAHVAAIVADPIFVDSAAHAADSASVAVAADLETSGAIGSGRNFATMADARRAILLRCADMVRQRIAFPEVLQAYARILRE